MEFQEIQTGPKCLKCQLEAGEGPVAGAGLAEASGVAPGRCCAAAARWCPLADVTALPWLEDAVGDSTASVLQLV